MAGLGYLSIAALIALTCLGVPLAFGVAIIGILGISLVMGVPQAAVQTYQLVFNNTTEFVLISIPLFILMGQLLAVGMLGRDIYSCAQKWLGWLPGGLAVTTVTSCAALGAVTGVSVAGIVALGPVALPEMRRYGYDNRLAAGSLASASTLAMLIPPSVSFIVYGIWTGTSIGKLFLAGVVPGLLLTAAFCAYIVATSIRNPLRAPRGPSYPFGERIRSLTGIAPVLVIFGVVIGGLYVGWFTPSEAAAVGCAVTAVLLLAMGRLNRDKVVVALVATAKLSVMIFAILIATQIFTRFLVLTDIQRQLVDAITGNGLNRYVILMLVLVLYLLLGMVMDGFSMMLITLPFVFPVIVKLGFDPIWFGVVLTIMIEVGLLTPPIGLNCYVLNKVEPGIRLGEVFEGVVPFILISLAMVGLFVLFPGIVTGLG